MKVPFVFVFLFGSAKIGHPAISTFHVWDAVLVYTARVQWCAAVKNANIASILYWKFCSVEGGRIWSSTCHFTLYWRRSKAI